MVAASGDGRPEFRLGGQQFTCRSRLPWDKFAGLMEKISAPDNEDSEMEVQLKFFRLCLISRDRKRFEHALVSDDDDDDDLSDIRIIGPEQVASLTEWLMDYYTGKMEASVSTSGTGLATTGESLNVVSLPASAVTSAT